MSDLQDGQYGVQWILYDVWLFLLWWQFQGAELILLAKI